MHMVDKIGGLFNPVYPFTSDVLHKSIERGCKYFVRNQWHAGYDHFDDVQTQSIIIAHYLDEQEASAHYQAIQQDKYRFLYDINIPEHLERLQKAAAQPTGFKVFSAYFRPDYKKLVTPRLKEKINSWMYRNTDWKPKKGQTVNVDFYLQFGQLFITMSFQGRKIKVRFEDIEIPA